jgi:pyruvate/2-oxoacid:ferredoxin oxidoreductase beta subunit
VKRQKGQMGDVRVVAQGGDGGTTDIGFGCLSGMFERNDDVLYICYDNGGYMNTGVQRSSATPPAARTATTMPVGPEPGNAFGQGKFVPAIAMAHEIPYVATATVADLRDLEYKVTKAMGMRGARYIHILVPCPLGWGAASKTPSSWRAWPRKPASFRFSRRKRRSHRRPEDPPAAAGRGISQAAEALCAPVRQEAGSGNDRPPASGGRQEHSQYGLLDQEAN